jgi:hypothetical protein
VLTADIITTNFTAALNQDRDKLIPYLAMIVKEIQIARLEDIKNNDFTWQIRRS